MKGCFNFGRDALLLETLSIIAKCQDQNSFWPQVMARLKWMLDFTRVDVALRNPDDSTYSLETIFELRANRPLISRTDLPLDKGIVGKMIRSGEACHCFNPRIQPFAGECIVDESLEGGSLSSILSVSLEANHKVLGVVSFGSIEEHKYCHQDIEIASRFATHAAVAIQNWQHLEKLREDAVLLDLAAAKARDSHSALESLVAKRTAALQALTQRLFKTQDDERRKVARDLHDSTGQTLAALKMSIAPLQEQFEDNEQVSAALNNIAGFADQALLEIRTTSYLLHPPLLDEAGLAAAVRWYTEGFSKRSGIDVKVTFPPNSERIPKHVEMVLFRLLQESLTNAHRHSRASIVNITLENSIEEVTFEVHDNGQGIAPELLSRLQKTNSNAGVGVAGMRERINDLNGQMQIASSPSGTTFRFTVPLASAQHLIRANQSETESLRSSAA
ncbi:MAG: ATP-binding protein [Limisphaerales bacterium]